MHYKHLPRLIVILLLNALNMEKKSSFWDSLYDFNLKLVMLLVPPTILLFVVSAIIKAVLLFSLQKPEELSPRQKQLEQTTQLYYLPSTETEIFPTE